MTNVTEGAANHVPAADLPLVSLVVPAFNEADNVPGLVELVQLIARSNPDYRFETVVVDDGSSDGTAVLLRDGLSAVGARFQVISLSRNFGSHAAITAGFRACRGDCAMTLSADLQEPLEVISRFLNAWRSGSDVVWGIRSTRSDPHGLAHSMSLAFSKWFHRWSIIPTYPEEGPSVVLVSRAVLEVVNPMIEGNRNIFGLVAWSGFTQTTLGFEQLARPAGRSKWTNAKKIKLVVDSFVEFSQTPPRVAGYLGATMCALAMALLVVAVVIAILPVTGAGYWFLGAAVLMTGGMNLGFLSVMGEYVWRAGDDARRRPIYVVRGRAVAGENTSVPTHSSAHDEWQLAPPVGAASPIL